MLPLWPSPSSPPWLTPDVFGLSLWAGIGIGVLIDLAIAYQNRPKLSEPFTPGPKDIQNHVGWKSEVASIRSEMAAFHSKMFAEIVAYRAKHPSPGENNNPGLYAFRA
jgi:hypothetical protein